MIRITAWKKTTEDWTIGWTHKGMYVDLTLSQTGPNPPDSGKWVVYVSGNDDFSISRLFDNLKEAKSCFYELVEVDLLSMGDLRSRGFDIS